MVWFAECVLWGVSLPEDGVDGAAGIGSGTRRKMILAIEDAKTDGLKKSVIDMSKSFLSNPILFLIFACNRPSRHLYPLRRLFHYLLPTILRQHPPHLALKYQPPIRHHNHNHTRYRRNNSLALSLPPALLFLPLLEFGPRNVLNHHLSTAQFE